MQINVINHSDITCLLRTTKNKEMLEVLAPSFTSPNFSKQEGEALTRELEDLGVEIEKTAIWQRGEKIWKWGEKQEDPEMWSDGECYHYERKRLTGIQVVVEEKYDFI